MGRTENKIYFEVSTEGDGLIFGVRARNVKEFYRIVGFLKPIVYICVKENKGVCYDALFDKSFSVTIET